MSAPAVLDKEDLRETVAQALDTEADQVTDTASFVDDLEVDSLMSLEVVVVLEKKYGVKFQEAELKQVSCLQNAYDLLVEKLA
ncbi:acyl carrier protein [Streptomyces sp. TP-A0874]|uniref:acyl carrier protein n=1 Tax=Streptomyces sp. TP-A0874 TaxID=549819 RepID=UPI000853DA1C|nr:acyl carrier protein [Streptomyces sp. TP-A0874]